MGDRQRLLGEPPAGLLAKPGDANSLADAILQVLNDSGLSESLRQRGLERAKDYYWDVLARQMEQVYLSLGG